MVGQSMKDEEFIKLSHFDRVRRGHFDKISNILMLLGFSTGIHIFRADPNGNTPFILAVAFLALGIYLKQRFIEKDDKELAGMKREIELEFSKRERNRKKGRRQ